MGMHGITFIIVSKVNGRRLIMLRGLPGTRELISQIIFMSNISRIPRDSTPLPPRDSSIVPR